MDPFAKLIERIIIEQQNIIGPLALEQARLVPGLKVDLDKHQVDFAGDRAQILGNLVARYQHLFGRASVEVCRSAARDLLPQLPPAQIPDLLR